MVPVSRRPSGQERREITTMAPLTIVGFASGSPLSQMAMARLVRDHRLVAIVQPPQREGMLRKFARMLLRRKNPLAAFGVPLIGAGEVSRFRPDIIVVASFPRIIPASVLAAARIGALNMHASALPRHRGVDGIFGTYWDDDSEAAITIHWIDERVDAGDIAAQKSLPLARGRPSRELYMELASIGVELLAGVLEEVSSGQMPRLKQDESRASYRSAADIARARLPFAEWPAERVWHVLSGLGDQRSGLVADATGRPLLHGRATHYRLASGIEPGRISVADAGYELHCRDGIVTLSGRRG
jgi:methionyl-tRNA formyltransferase